ncbi:hypothetical protein V866_002843 [Kwoniella sp. B9012]
MVRYTRATAPSRVGGRPNITTINPAKSSTHSFYDLFNGLQMSPPSFTTNNIQTDIKAEVEEDYSTGSDHSLERGNEVDEIEGVYQDDRKKVVGRGIVGETSYDDSDNKDDIEIVEAEEEEVESCGGSGFCLGDEGSSGSEGMSEEEDEVEGTAKFGGRKPNQSVVITFESCNRDNTLSNRPQRDHQERHQELSPAKTPMGAANRSSDPDEHTGSAGIKKVAIPSTAVQVQKSQIY